MRQRTKVKFSEIGCTNAAHSDAECKVIEASLHRAEEALLNLPASAVTLRKKSADEVRRYKIALAPHKKLPADIWLHIFQLCSALGLDSGKVSVSPLQVLPQVCSGWRRILMACPAFWSNVCTDNSPYALSYARVWLSRAGNIPRSWKIVDVGASRLDVVQEILSLFPFRTLDITLPGSDMLATLQLSEIPIESLLPLEELSLNHERNGRVSFSPHSLPNLTLLIVGESLTFLIFDVPRPFATWPKLRNLILRCPLPKSECFSILRNVTSSLEECSMFVRSSGSETNSILEGIVLPNLATLKLYFRLERPQPFLDMLTLPNLTSLHLGNASMAEGDGGCDEETLRRLAERSGMKKTETLMISNAVKRLDVGVLLEILPSLCRLEIISNNAPLDMSTTDRIGSGGLGPRLRVLHLRGNQQLPSLLSMTESLVRRRQTLGHPKMISPLEQVVVDGCTRLGESEERRIRQLSNGGIKFEVQDISSIGTLSGSFYHWCACARRILA